MESDERRPDQNNNVSRSGSMDSTNPIESFKGSMDVDEGKGGSGHDVPSGRVHKGGRKLVCA